MSSDQCSMLVLVTFSELFPGKLHINSFIEAHRKAVMENV